MEARQGLWQPLVVAGQAADPRCITLRGMVVEEDTACTRCYNVAAGVVARGGAVQIAGANHRDPVRAVAVGGVARQDIVGPASEDTVAAAVVVCAAVVDRAVAVGEEYPVKAVAVCGAVTDRVGSTLLKKGDPVLPI